MSLTNKEAMQALIDGKKIRSSNWEKGYFCRVIREELFNQDGVPIVFCFGNGWEIYDEPRKKKKITYYKYYYLEEHSTMIYESGWTTNSWQEFSGYSVISLIETEEREFKIDELQR